MRKLTTIFVLLCCFGSMVAQNNAIDRVLWSIEQNNKELQASEHDLTALKQNARIDNNLTDPSVSYTYQYGKQKDVANENELEVTQDFDFPTLYAARNKYGKLMNEAYEKRFAMARRDILLEAKLLCLDLIGLNRQRSLLSRRKANMEEMVRLSEKSLQEGDASILETNKLKLELMNINTEVAENDVEYRTALQRLLAMNGNKPLTFEETEYPVLPELTSYESIRDEVFEKDYELQSIQAEQEAARKMVSVNKQGWLPKLQVGYRRNETFREQLNGFIVGGTIPLFENRGKVKKAKSELLSAELQQEDAMLKIEAELQAQYNEAKQLKQLMNTYDMSLMENTLDYLKQAMSVGQISALDYLVGVKPIYENLQKYMELENRYQKIVANLYKNSL